MLATNKLPKVNRQYSNKFFFSQTPQPIHHSTSKTESISNPMSPPPLLSLSQPAPSLTWAAAQPPLCSCCLHLCPLQPHLCTEPEDLSRWKGEHAPPRLSTLQGLLISFKSLDSRSHATSHYLLISPAPLTLLELEASLLWHRCPRHTPTTGPLIMLFLLPGILFSTYPLKLTPFRSLI